MGIYTTGRYFNEAPDYASQIPANEAYNAAFGCAHILADCQANDMALFESAIYDDMQEVMSIHEGYTYVNENAFTNVINKIIETFKKLIAKIKGIFKSFIAKLAGAVKNGKDLVKKYEKQIIKYSNWKDFKVKGIRKPKKDGWSADIKSNIEEVLTFLTGASSGVSYEITLKNTNVTYEPLDGLDSYDKINDIDTDDLKKAIAQKGYIKSTASLTIGEFKDIAEEVRDHLYDDEDEIDGDDDKVSGSFFSAKWIKDVLSNQKGSSSDWDKVTQKTADNADKIINQIIDDLNKTSTNLAKWQTADATKGKDIDASSDITLSFTGRDSSSTDAVDKHTSKKSGAYDSDKFGKGMATGGVKTDDVQKAIHALQKVASNEQEVITKMTSVYMDEIKFAMGQARKVWTAAAAWSSTTHKEDASYYQALGEAAEEQFYMNMESI